MSDEFNQLNELKADADHLEKCRKIDKKMKLHGEIRILVTRLWAVLGFGVLGEGLWEIEDFHLGFICLVGLYYITLIILVVVSMEYPRLYIVSVIVILYGFSTYYTNDLFFLMIMLPAGMSALCILSSFIDYRQFRWLKKQPDFPDFGTSPDKET